MAAPSTSPVVLRLTDVVKTFPGVVALNGVTFEVTQGEVHALVGENGAGKSTLMAVAAGSTAPDSGAVEIGGQLLEQASPAAAQALGLAVVYQHLSILEDLTVSENMVFAMPRRLRPTVAHASAWTRTKVEAAGAHIDPAARVGELSIADRQLLEIAKALALESKVLVLDEPTESLTPAETARLFERIRSITAGGTAVVYISHRLPEVEQIADRITVLRDGETRGTLASERVLRGRGPAPDHRARRRPGLSRTRAPGTESEPLLVAKGLSGLRFRDVDLEVAAGEIVGLAGVEGNGQREFLRALAGLIPAQGTVLLRGRPLAARRPGGHPAGRRRAPPRRPARRRADAASVGAREHRAAHARLGRHAAASCSAATSARVVDDQIERLSIKTPTADTPVSSLSGGNQQKVLFARSLLAAPTVLLADEPTRGVDAGARMELYQLLRGAADDGKAVVVLSSDVVELQGLCDRVLVFSRGEIVRSLEGDAITEENITGAAITSASSRESLAARARRALRMRRFAAGDYLPSVVLLALILGLGAYTSSSNSRFLSSFNFNSMLLLTSALGLIALGQLIVLLTGAIDLSVGPLTGLVGRRVLVLRDPGPERRHARARLPRGDRRRAGRSASRTRCSCASSASPRCWRRSRPTSRSRASRSCCARSRAASSARA